ncbi:sulfotransferase domain-containing protein [Marinicella litoralis]|uniref:Sulfotransferase domain-containing protein n=1 Tax=Marinicella litoralis TaxID=644220 RepID=A0A4V3DIS0_9GAMM|nr:sulfotransferase domain-containing protein [Marinicella litoralis]TDR23251.1 sulfotransferase domain-containing protein [Marinicella litoralis]
MGNILWIASYPKSGNTWVRAFLHNYLDNKNTAVDINTLHRDFVDEVKAFRYQPFLTKGQSTTDLSIEEVCAIRPMVQAQMAAEAPATLFVKTHNFQGAYKGFPLHNWQVSSGAIYIVRNPLDVAVSLKHYFDYSYDEAIAYMAADMAGTPNEVENVPQVISSWSQHVASWTQEEGRNMLVLRYEDLLAHTQRSFRKVESLLGLKKDVKRLAKAIRFSSFKQLKQQEQQTGFAEKHENAGHFFRKGHTEQWREELSDAQIRQIITDHKTQMQRFKYIPKDYI